MWHYIKDKDFPEVPKEVDLEVEVFCINVFVTLESKEGRSVSEAMYCRNANAINPKYVRYDGDIEILNAKPLPEGVFLNIEVNSFTMAGGDWDKKWTGPDYVVPGMGYCDDPEDPVRIIAWMYPPEPARG